MVFMGTLVPNCIGAVEGSVFSHILRAHKVYYTIHKT